ncbi:MAG: type I-C CRISPR-associated protein Cas5c [Chloroflexi bacterium]|nr:type I-C CRISPR-associated protein Cas5c [Chloroflexota bacterium]
MNPKDQVLEVWGDFACFTRPEMKVERFSYPVITPSAARGIYDAIYCKPNRDPTRAEFGWQVTMVEMLSPPAYIALRRNEVKDKAPSVATIMRWMQGKDTPEPLWADGTPDQLGTDQKGRTQRQTMALKNVRYRLHAEVRPWRGFEDRLQAIEAQFRRRASHGKCIYQPCFGCREFPAFFELVEPGASQRAPEPLDIPVGVMLYDVFDLSRPGSCDDPPSISLFRAEVRQGVLKVPVYDSQDVLKPTGRDA